MFRFWRSTVLTDHAQLSDGTCVLYNHSLGSIELVPLLIARLGLGNRITGQKRLAVNRF